MRRNFILAIMSRSEVRLVHLRGQLGTCRGLPGARRQIEDVHGTGAATDLPQPGAYRLTRDRPRRPGGLERAVAEREMRGERGRVRAPRAVRGAVGVADACEELDRAAVEEHVRDLVAVAAGHDHVLRAEAMER